MNLFNNQWETYKKVVDNDYMEHSAASKATKKTLNDWISKRKYDMDAPNLVDLGCGDLNQMGDFIKNMALNSYTGVDIALPALNIAAEKLKDVSYKVEWKNKDLLEWVMLDAKSDSIHILHSAFALHHLTEAQKEMLLRKARTVIKNEGIFIWTDVFRPSGEKRCEYLDRYTKRIWDDWKALNHQQKEMIANHVTELDWPSEKGAITTMALQLGWNLNWLWDGKQHAEATAILTPTQRH